MSLQTRDGMQTGIYPSNPEDAISNWKNFYALWYPFAYKQLDKEHKIAL